MFGTNKVAEPFHDAEGSLRVNDLFYTLQGEGPDAGRPAIFLRLQGCNLRCYFCDTEFEQGREMSVGEIIDKIKAERQRATGACNLVVITGGEPLLQNIFPLVHAINAMLHMTVTVETAGTVWPSPDLHLLFKADRRHSPYGNAIICSPKTPRIDSRVAVTTHAIKYIVNHGETSHEDGLPIKSTQIANREVRIARPNLFNSHALIYVQPMDTGDPHKNRINQLLASAICMEHGYRLSIQLHKIVDLP